MLDVPIEMLPSTAMTDLDLAVASGGFEGGEPIDGGGSGPSASELTIQGMYEKWPGDPTRDGPTASFDDGAMFFDSDGNGYYDYLEIAIDTGYFEYEPETDTWTWHPYNDRDPD